MHTFFHFTKLKKKKFQKNFIFENGIFPLFLLLPLSQQLLQRIRILRHRIIPRHNTLFQQERQALSVPSNQCVALGSLPVSGMVEDRWRNLSLVCAACSVYEWV